MAYKKKAFIMVLILSVANLLYNQFISIYGLEYGIWKVIKEMLYISIFYFIGYFSAIKDYPKPSQNREP